MNLFDSIQDTAFDVVTTTFGVLAKWIPKGGGEEKTAKVLYKDPTESQQIGNTDYDAPGYTMEYKKGDFEGLKERADDGILDTVSIEQRDGSFISFLIQNVKLKYDGRTMVAILHMK
ncbi:head-tail joining protein [Arachidicoccus terrestris]|uniref:head-tail joining protein n=1 Tax=Arachidicoccus terrestris TaxID=2875539 RepID=UPI001CC414EE|nr:hypothetical protein [Arachidicoccus terrestris]UAY56261.1 hypothetical protein K9M52_04380 [Arachidicoccus terrestris]